MAQATGTFQRSMSSFQAGHQYDLLRQLESTSLVSSYSPLGCLFNICLQVFTTKSPVADMSRVKSHMRIVVWKLLSEYSSPLSEEQRTQSRSLELKRD